MKNKMVKWKILLITNRDSDNVGDQVIEISDIGLIHTIMKNLDIEKSDYSITSRAAGFITKKYLETEDPELLEDPERAIKNADLVIFGGAPLFNYAYQMFYKRTAITLEIAQKYNKPVLFSGIGIEGYDEENKKCQRLKKTLNFDCVKQITTRDGIEYLKQYKENENLIIDKVADPAVFSSVVLKDFCKKEEHKRKKVGIFVLRAMGFIDNGVNITREEAAEMWVNLAHELEKKNIDYEFLTSGNFGDEAVLERLIRKYGIHPDKCVFNMNNPETLLRRISVYDGVISCRLHPSIISYSLNIPSVGLVWNSKIRAFYENTGYTDRIVEAEEFKAEVLADKIEKSMNQGIMQNTEFMMSIYNTLFTGIQRVLCKDVPEKKPYSYDELMENMWSFPGTSAKETTIKLKRKCRRTYEQYNRVSDLLEEKRKEIQELKQFIHDMKFRVIYNSGTKVAELKINNESANVWRTESGAYEYDFTERYYNTGENQVEKIAFEYPERNFAGWRMRIKDRDGNWYWYMNNQKLMPVDQYDSSKKELLYRLKDEDRIPYLKDMKIDVIVLEAEWKSGICSRVLRKLRGNR